MVQNEPLDMGRGRRRSRVGGNWRGRGNLFPFPDIFSVLSMKNLLNCNVAKGLNSLAGDGIGRGRRRSGGGNWRGRGT